MALLPSQKRDVFDYLEAGAIPDFGYPAVVVDRFEYHDTAEGALVRLKDDKPVLPYAMRILAPGYLRQEFEYEFSPGLETQSESRAGTWANSSRFAFGTWLGHLSRELNAPDPWAALALQRQILEVPPTYREGPGFTEDEQQSIK